MRNREMECARVKAANEKRTFSTVGIKQKQRRSSDIEQTRARDTKSAGYCERPFVLEFVGIPEKQVYLEGELEDRLIANLQDFLLELGKGFAFIGRQYKINIGSRHFYVDLVFYHRILKCFVLIDLKRGEIEHNDIGQMNLYLNYFKKEENTEGDNEPIGIVLGAYKDKVLIEYATQGISNQLFVSRYQLYLPDKKQLQEELRKLMDYE